MGTIPYVTESNFPVRHGFFGRHGGVSEGLFHSLNCGFSTGDVRENVVENRDRVAEAIGTAPEMLVTVHQVHGNECIYVPQNWEADPPKADAMVTDVPGLALGILTADCGPVLFCGEKGDGSPVVGAAHAGWGGALRGVLENTVKAMLKTGCSQDSLRVVIGPCIGPESYEVSDSFVGPFLEQDQDNARFFKSGALQRKGHTMFDLPSYIRKRLETAGVGYIYEMAIDTYSHEMEYFSHRRMTHRNEPNSGRQISVAMIKEYGGSG